MDASPLWNVPSTRIFQHLLQSDIFTQQEATCPCRDLDIQSSLTGNGPKLQGNQMFIHTLVSKHTGLCTPGEQRSGESSLLIPAAPLLPLRTQAERELDNKKAQECCLIPFTQSSGNTHNSERWEGAHWLPGGWRTPGGTGS